MNSNFTHLSLFSGIGGLDLAAEMAGFQTVGQCEFADFQTKVLEKHWPHVPRWRDIHTLTGDDFYATTGLRTVDILSGGFPCQPFSVAGQQKGREDERYLWPEMLRVITQLKPHFVLGENVPGILRTSASDIVSELERAGYNCVVFAFEAAAVGAQHRRERVFFLGECPTRSKNVSDSQSSGMERQPAHHHAEQAEQTVERQSHTACGERAFRCGSIQNGALWWSGATESGVDRVAHGIPNRVDKLKSLGNAVVPAQAYPIFKAVMEELIHMERVSA